MPFIAPNGLEYLDATHRLLDEPINSWRNNEILTIRRVYARRGAPRLGEDNVAAFIDFHDNHRGPPPIPR